jgi:23S rRNA pseudouridine2605 synthase
MASDEITGGERLRLQLFLSRAGLASRRKAEEYITAGRVSVNGEIVRELGYKCLPTDRVEVDGKALSIIDNPIYLLVYKPAGYICSTQDEQGRPTVFDLVNSAYKTRLFNVGRLDCYSEGLIILTNDGNFSQELQHPSREVEKEYEVTTREEIPDSALAEFRSGISMDGIRYTADSCRRLGPSQARIILHEGKNREIRRVFDYLGLTVLRLIRVRIGTLTLGDLHSGEYRTIDQNERTALLKSRPIERNRAP